jgi:hypothetical protein
MDSAENPKIFIEDLTAHLWSTHQIDDFRATARHYTDAWHRAKPDPPPICPRLFIAIFPRDLSTSDYELFRKLRHEGIFFPAVDAADAWPTILEAASARAERHPVDYGHWYIDGGTSDAIHSSRLTCVSWDATKTIRNRVLARMHTAVNNGSGSGGVESHDGEAGTESSC